MFPELGAAPGFAQQAYCPAEPALWCCQHKVNRRHATQQSVGPVCHVPWDRPRGCRSAVGLSGREPTVHHQLPVLTAPHLLLALSEVVLPILLEDLRHSLTRMGTLNHVVCVKECIPAQARHTHHVSSKHAYLLSCANNELPTRPPSHGSYLAARAHAVICCASQACTPYVSIPSARPVAPALT